MAIIDGKRECFPTKIVHKPQMNQNVNLFWHNEPSERLFHQVVQPGQAFAQLNKGTAIVTRLRLLDLHFF